MRANATTRAAHRQRAALQPLRRALCTLPNQEVAVSVLRVDYRALRGRAAAAVLRLARGPARARAAADVPADRSAGGGAAGRAVGRSPVRRRDGAALDRGHQPEPVRLHARHARRHAVPRRQPRRRCGVPARPASRRAAAAPSSRSSSRSASRICRGSPTSSVAPHAARQWNTASTARSASTRAAWVSPCSGR